MSPVNKRRQPGSAGETIALWVAIGLVLMVVGVLYAAMHLGHALAGTGVDVPANPFTIPFALIGGDLPWPGAYGWAIVAAAGLFLLLLGALVTVVVIRFRRRRTRVDPAGTHMGRGKDVAALSHKQVSKKAERLGVESAPGLPIGVTVSSGQRLLSSWEDMRMTIAGPRTGKTTAMVVPEILTAPGAVLTTSNKRDVVDATRDVRAKNGPVWVFDPQALSHESPTWWWNPLSYVTDEVRAAKLAQHFAAGSRQAGAKTDAYFDPAGQDLLAGLLLAAALERRPITQVYTWLTRPSDDTAAEILRQHDFPLTADQVSGVVDAPEKQRGGVFGTAQQMASCLTNRQVAAWVTPQGQDDQRPQFHPEHFVRTASGTLYSLSKEGQGTAGPLVTALTVAVVEAAEEYAAGSAGGRLTTPLVGILDEAANVCRWRDLPDLYSHYGSRGIVLDTVLQSWSQGTEVWGEAGMKKLWSAANIKVYAGGVSEAAFLEDLSRMIGEHERITSSLSVGNGHRSVSRQTQRERTLDVADLAALPQGRAIVLASGSRPTLIRLVPWMSGPHADEVRASIEAHQPGPPTTATIQPERA